MIQTNYILSNPIFFNISPQFEPLFSRLRLWEILLKVCCGSGFVNISASWSAVDMKRTSSCLRATCSRTKWKSTLMCFVLAWKTGFTDRYVAPMLSHQRTGGLDWYIPNSFKSDCIHISSAIALTSDLLWTVCGNSKLPCWFQDTLQTHLLNVDHLNTQPSLSQKKALNKKVLSFCMSSPMDEVPCMNLRILFTIA